MNIRYWYVSTGFDNLNFRGILLIYLVFDCCWTHFT